MRETMDKLTSIEDVKNQIISHVGNGIGIREYNKQGKIVHEYSGTITQTFDNLFLIKININNYSINKSFTYADLTLREREYEIIS